jgi:hypothetical protein
MVRLVNHKINLEFEKLDLYESLAKELDIDIRVPEAMKPFLKITYAIIRKRFNENKINSLLESTSISKKLLITYKMI